MHTKTKHFNKFFILFCPIAIAAVFAFGCSDKKSVKRDTFMQDTFINGLAVNGLTVDEASHALFDTVESVKNEYRCELIHSDGRFILTGSELNLETNIDEILKEALKKPGEHRIEVFPKKDEKLRAALSNIADVLNTPPVNARLVKRADLTCPDDASLINERFAVTKSSNGRRLDIDAAEEFISSGAVEIVLPFLIEKADKALPELPVRLSFFSTSFNTYSLSVPNRVKNIEIAASKLNGVAVQCGETLSCNEILGERNAENGWATATVFSNNGKETSQGYGGGICQVSTTLYNAALLAGLDITERHPHSRKVAYVDGGRDASLSWELFDLKILNNTNDMIYVFMWTDAQTKSVCCEIYGKSWDDAYERIEIETSLVNTIEPTEPEFTYDPQLKNGECVLVRKAIRGSVYSTARLFKSGDELVSKEILPNTYYLMHPALYAVPAPQSVLP